MEPKDRDYFKTKLLQIRAQLADTVKKTETYGREADTEDEAKDIADKASSSYTKEFMFSKSTNDRRFLAGVSEALQRLESEDEFGVCQNCGEEVGRKRLEAVPWTRLCIECQELEEQGRL